MSIYSELKRRNVFRVAVAYVIVGWLILQVGEVLAPALRLPDWVNSTLAFFIILGFPLAVVFAWAFEMTPEGLKREKDVDRTRSITHRTGQKLNHAIIALLALALALFAYDKFVLDPGRDAAQVKAALESAQEADAGATLAGAGGKSIAVLPFVNMSNDPDQEYFSDGIAEELLNVLARYPGLRVAARTSSFQFKGQNLDIADIARQLRVNHVLEGSVRKAGNRVRITAQLIEADAGYHLWSETFDRQLDDIFAIQDEISEAIGSALQVTLGLDGQNGGNAPTVAAAADPRAFEAYVEGRQLINLRGKESMARAIGPLKRALELDPDYAPAHAQLAIAYIMLSNSPGTYGDWPLDEAVALAQPHIDRALALDEQLPEAYGARALIHLNRSEWEGAVREGRRALAINPSYADVMNWLHIAYDSTGLHKESYEMLMALLRIDPLNVAGRSNAVSILAMMGQLEEARAMASSIEEQWPAGAWAALGGIAIESEGEIAEALRLYQRALVEEPDNRGANSWVGYLFAHLGMMPEALRVDEVSHHWVWFANRELERVIAHFEARLATDPDSYTFRYRLARTHYLAGHFQAALSLFEELLSEAGGRPLFSDFYSSLPTAWIAYMRQHNGDKEGVEALLALVEADQSELDRANKKNGWYYRTAAAVATLRGEDDVALARLQQALDAGSFEWHVLDDPIFAHLSERAEFLDLRRQRTDWLAAERAKVLGMLCRGEPEPMDWAPLPETCKGEDLARN